VSFTIPTLAWFLPLLVVVCLAWAWLIHRALDKAFDELFRRQGWGPYRRPPDA
jgi:hypothetical protein